MIGAITSGAISTASTIAQQYAQMQAVGAASSSIGDSEQQSGSGSISAVSGDQAQISGPGQLLGQLQQLQTQDPAKFQQLLTTISNQLSTAAQQTTGSQSQFLTDLASNMQSAADTGNLSALRPHHHAHEGQGVYNQQGQVTPTSTTSTGTTTGDTSSGGTSMQQLFTNIATEISTALGG